MVWSNNEQWMLTGDHSGFIKYWQSNMNNVKMYQGHREAVRGIRLVLLGGHPEPLWFGFDLPVAVQIIGG